MLAYTLANKTEKALKAYERAHAWRELFALAVNEKLSEKAISDMVERVAGKLPPKQEVPSLWETTWPRVEDISRLHRCTSNTHRMSTARSMPYRPARTLPRRIAS